MTYNLGLRMASNRYYSSDSSSNNRPPMNNPYPQEEYPNPYAAPMVQQQRFRLHSPYSGPYPTSGARMRHPNNFNPRTPTDFQSPSPYRFPYKKNQNQYYRPNTPYHHNDNNCDNTNNYRSFSSPQSSSFSSPYQKNNNRSSYNLFRPSMLEDPWANMKSIKVPAGGTTLLLEQQTIKFLISMNDPIIRKKIREYETFLNDRLRTDLQHAWNARDRLFTDIAEYERLKTTINTFIELLNKNKKLDSDLNEPGDDTLLTQIDLGCSFFAQAECTLNNYLFLSIGFGLYCELSYDEALQFIETKVKYLREQEEDLSKKIAHIKANIKLVLQALKEIQTIDDKSKTPLK
ncbi:unnamed protein product [Didymodactylos carnosus]|uniref:Uncharacterized protein n=1 Tax=Didymodactylos carnosus TaxID=1234261 RepID=A0A814QQT4_9BILA|nr:unnamed protein product [Didymodactylos carnosus]CAF3886443.1 unnamed protein product [Didymodactylos carnosus]